MARRRAAEGCVLERALRAVRLRQQRLGRDLSVDSADNRRATDGARRQERLCARRGRRPQRSRWPIRKLVRKARAAATKEFGVESNFTRSAEDEPLYRI